MNDERLDELVAATSPISDAMVRSLDLGAAETELMEAIMATTPTTDLGTVGDTSPRPRRRRTRRYRVAVGLVAAVAAVTIAVVGVATRPDTETAPTGSYTEVPLDPSRPHILLDREGWSITYVGEEEARMPTADSPLVRLGQMSFEGPGGELAVVWEDVSQYENVVGPYSDPSAPYTPLDVPNDLGLKVTVYIQNAGPEPESPYLTAFATVDGARYFLRFILHGIDQASFGELIGSLVSVSAEDWYASMPDDVVLPDEKPAEVDALLATMPVPPSFDSDEFHDNTLIESPDTLRRRLVMAVACVWRDEWETAVAASDDSGEQAAIEAFVTMPGWSFTVDGSTEQLEQWADEIADGTLTPPQVFGNLGYSCDGGI